MPVDYNKISEKFSKSRENMKWQEIDYFLEHLQNSKPDTKTILDVGCGNGRLLWELLQSNVATAPENYLWVDMSSWMIEQAQKKYPRYSFAVCDMKNLDQLQKKFDIVFLIASFHHLEHHKDRLWVLKNLRNILHEWWIVYMTNWDLQSDLNHEKYKDSKIIGSKNIYWGSDYHIKLWEYLRFYHSFTEEELASLFTETWYSILENRCFENGRNIISILKLA